MESEIDVIEKIIRWGTDRSAVRAMILTSTRTVPGGRLDVFSDFDVILAVENVRPFYESRTWLGDFGPVLVIYRDPIRKRHGLESFAYITQYEDGLKIDFTLWPVETLGRIAVDPQLPDELDVGYRVLLDKDGLTENLQPPSYQAYIPQPPNLEEYLTNIEVFFHEATYVAKHLWRDDLLPAKYSFDNVMKQGYLHEMLVWQMEINHEWAVKPGALGKGLKKYLPAERWQELAGTYVGPGLEENWAALFRTVVLFRKIAREVGEQLGFVYPNEVHRRTMNYLEKVRWLDQNATTFPS